MIGLLTARQELILKLIIKNFTKDHEPVGSKTLMAQMPMKVSSATIRNEMAVLEDLGLIEKTHSSSGRIPSMLGYRFYLDNLVEPADIPSDVYQTIMTSLNQPYHQVNDIFAEAAKILSDLTSYTAFAVGPEKAQVLITGFRIVPLNEHQLMAIMVTSDGNVHNQIYSVANVINPDEIEKAVKMINENLVGKSVMDVNEMTLQEMVKSIGVNEKSADSLLSLLMDVLKNATSEQLYVDGQINLLNNYHEDNAEQIKSLYEMINQNQNLNQLLDLDQFNQDLQNSPVSKIQVKLGNELPADLENYSLITAHYSIQDHGNGVIALLGPSNMPYSEMIGLMDYFRTEFARKLIDYYGHYQ